MTKNDDKQPPSIDQSVTSHNQSGGITAHTVNLGPQQRQLDAGMKQQLVSMLPKDRTIKVDAPMGDGEAITFSQEVWNFLAAAGYTMHKDGLSQAVRMPAPRGQSVDLTSEPGVAYVVIGHR